MINSAFTCTGPYAILIMLGIKQVENRNMMPVPEKGRCAIGCSKSFCREEFGRFVRWASENLPEEDLELTRHLCSSADLLGTKLFDHLIITQKGSRSLVSS